MPSLWRKLIRRKAAPAPVPAAEAAAASGAQAAPRFLSLLTPEEMGALPVIPSEAMVVFLSGATGGDCHTVNPVFVSFLHDVIRRAAPLDQDLQEAAARQGDGYTYIIDLRTPDGPQGDVPFEDVIGAFPVARGLIDPDKYWINDQYSPFGPNGLVRLPATLRAALVEAVRQHAASNSRLSD